jgi:nitrate/TMAO reductase-like tetraheme cytochrome c subunit
MTSPRRILLRFSRPLRIIIQLGILAVILGGIATVGFIEYSAQPSFCTNCHIMQPYYDYCATSTVARRASRSPAARAVTGPHPGSPRRRASSWTILNT